jgi:hypothetical protein
MEWQLKLAVGLEGVEIDTLPQVMANASPVFRRMLQPDRFAEGQNLSKTDSLVVRLPEDDVSAMTTLCDIFHLRSNKIPVEDVTSNTLADIATLVDKYDCAAAIQPWPRIWLAQVLDRQELEGIEDMGLGEVGKWIHISCHLGFAEQFNQLTSTFIRRVSHKDFCQGPLLLHYKKLSQAVQGTRDSALGTRLPSCLHWQTASRMLDTLESIRTTSFASNLLKISKRAIVAGSLIPIIGKWYSTAPLWSWATPSSPQKSSAVETIGSCLRIGPTAFITIISA